VHTAGCSRGLPARLGDLADGLRVVRPLRGYPLAPLLCALLVQLLCMLARRMLAARGLRRRVLARLLLAAGCHSVRRRGIHLLHAGLGGRGVTLSLRLLEAWRGASACLLERAVCMRRALWHLAFAACRLAHRLVLRSLARRRRGRGCGCAARQVAGRRESSGRDLLGRSCRLLPLALQRLLRLHSLLLACTPRPVQPARRKPDRARSTPRPPGDGCLGRVRTLPVAHVLLLLRDVGLEPLQLGPPLRLLHAPRLGVRLAGFPPSAAAAARCFSWARAAAPASTHVLRHSPARSSEPSQQSAASRKQRVSACDAAAGTHEDPHQWTALIARAPHS